MTMSKNLQKIRVGNIKGIWRIGLAAILYLVLTGSVFAQTGSKNVRSPSASGSKSSTETSIKDTEVYLKVAAIKDNAGSEDQYLNLGKGQKFVSVQIILDNRGEDEWLVKPDKFKLKDAKGNVYGTDTTSLLNLIGITEPTLKSCVVDGGDFVRGWVTFEVDGAADVKSSRFRYEDTDLFSKTTVKSGWIALSPVSD